MATLESPVFAPKERKAVLVLHLLGECNLRCRHCYMNSGVTGKSQLRLEVVLRCLDEAALLGVGLVCISGGEPFLYPQIGDVLSHLAGSRDYEVAISTNGTLIRSAEAALLESTGTIAQISIDGDETYHDWFRGQNGAFRSATRAISELVHRNVPVTVVTTICRDNLEYLPDLARWASDNGVQFISIQPLQKLGRAVGISERRLTPEETCELFLQASDLGYAYTGHGLEFRMAYQSRDYLLEHPCAAYVCNGAKCHRGVTKEIKTLVVREDGTVLPEMATLNPRFALGSVYNASLQDLIANYFRNGYQEFHALCNSVYLDVVPAWKSPLIPWNEILSERSWTYEDTSDSRESTGLLSIAGSLNSQ